MKDLLFFDNRFLLDFWTNAMNITNYLPNRLSIKNKKNLFQKKYRPSNNKISARLKCSLEVLKFLKKSTISQIS